MKKSAMVAAVLAATSMSPMVNAETVVDPIKVGVLDARGDRLVNSSKAVTVHYREFASPGNKSASAKTSTGWDHGVLVATAAVRQIRGMDAKRPVDVYAANAFIVKGIGTDGQPRIGIDHEGAKDAVKWFKNEGVKVVVTSFVGRDSQGFRDFMSAADEAGLVIVAPIANFVTSEVQYPAAYPSAISVAAFNVDMPVRKDAAVAGWVQFATDGSLPIRPVNGHEDYGSSFAAARVAGMLAVIDSVNPITSTQDARVKLSSFTEGKPYSIGNKDINLPYISVSGTASRFEAYKREASRDRSRDEDVLVASAFLRAGRQAGR